MSYSLRAPWQIGIGRELAFADGSRQPFQLAQVNFSITIKSCHDFIEPMKAANNGQGPDKLRVSTYARTYARWSNSIQIVKSSVDRKAIEAGGYSAGLLFPGLHCRIGSHG